MALDPSLAEFTTTTPPIASYNYEDIANGLGFISFFLMKTFSNAATIWSLSTEAMYSSSIETQQNPGSTTVTFDSSPFNIARTVRGTAFISIGTISSLAGGNDNIEIQLWKWDGSSATAITSKFTTTITDADATLTNTMPCTTTHIAVGEQLRLIIKVTVSGGGEWIKWGHDPAGRTGSMTVTSAKINIPFRIDL